MHQRRCGFVLVVYYRVKKTRQTQKHTSMDVFSCSACIGAVENTPNTKTHQHGCGFMLGVFGKACHGGGRRVQEGGTLQRDKEETTSLPCRRS